MDINKNKIDFSLLRFNNELPAEAIESVKKLISAGQRPTYYKGIPIYKSDNIRPICRECGKAASYEYRSKSSNANRTSSFACRTHRNELSPTNNQRTNEFWDEIKLEKPILRYNAPSHDIWRVPKYIRDSQDISLDGPEIDMCNIYRVDSVPRLDGVRVTIHECAAHWVIVTWVPEASL